MRSFFFLERHVWCSPCKSPWFIICLLTRTFDMSIKIKFVINFDICYVGFRSILYSILKPSSAPSRLSEVSSGFDSTTLFSELKASLNPSRLSFRARSALSRVSVFLCWKYCKNYQWNLRLRLSGFTVWGSSTKNKRIYCRNTGFDNWSKRVYVSAYMFKNLGIRHVQGKNYKSLRQTQRMKNRFDFCFF